MADKVYTIPAVAKTPSADNVQAVVVGLRDLGIPITAKAVAEKLGCGVAGVGTVLEAFVKQGKLKARAEAVEPSLGGGVAKDLGVI